MERLKEYIVVLPDRRIDRLKHTLEDIRKLRRESVDDTTNPGPVETAGEDGTPCDF